MTVDQSWMTRNLTKSGAVVVSDGERGRWGDDPHLREQVRLAGCALASNNRQFAVVTNGGALVDVYDVDHWQSGAGS